MNDLELMELAAKAAGIVSLVYRDGTDSERLQREGKGQFVGSTWHPLGDDGDAFRLAVDLRIAISNDEQKENLNSPFCSRFVYAIGKSHETGAAEMANSDPRAATRRAIVRAAAAIGEAMP